MNAKEQIIKIACDAEQGIITYLEAYVRIQEIEKIAKEYKGLIKEGAIDEAEQMKGQVYRGYLIDTPAPRIWDFTKIEEVEEAKKKLDALKDKWKKITINNEKGDVLVDEDTGEIIEGADYEYSPRINLNKHDKKQLPS